MTYLVDTDVVVSWLKGRSQETDLLTQLSSDGLAISLITYGEIYDGIYYGRDPDQNRQVFQEFLRWVDVLPLNRRIMQRFARIRGICANPGSLSVIQTF
jgi:predicted nucleic acid-binding protein